MKVFFEAKCLKCDGQMDMVDTTDYDDTFHCKKCNYSIEVRPRHD